MKPFASYKSPTAAVAAMVLLLGSATASAKTPSDVADLVGARGAGAETEIGNRGYTYVTMTHGVQYWWNAERKACVGVKVADGRYKSVSAARASYCHQSGKAAKGASRSSGSDVSSEAKTNCMVAVNNTYGGKVGDIVVTSSEFSQANSIVMMQAGPETWKCLVSNTGKVQEVSVVGTR